MKNAKIHFTHEELISIRDVALQNGGDRDTYRYYDNYQQEFNRLFREKAGRKDITTGYAHSGKNSFPKHTHMPDGYGKYNYEVYEIVKSEKGFTEAQVKEMDLEVPYHHDFHVSFDTGVATIHYGTGNISMNKGAGQYTSYGKIIKAMRRIAKDISFSVETEDGDILIYKY